MNKEDKHRIKEVLRKHFGFNQLSDLDLVASYSYQSRLRKSHIQICKSIEKELNDR
jgi:hypothetical protein